MAQATVMSELPDEVRSMDEVQSKIEELAREDGISPQEFLGNLVMAEDFRRHYDHPPFEDPVRANCGRPRCAIAKLKFSVLVSQGKVIEY